MSTLGKIVLVLLVLLGLIAAYYYLVYKPSLNVPSEPGAPPSTFPTVTPPTTVVADVDTGLETGPEPDSVKVLYADITEAPAPGSNFSTFLKTAGAPTTPRMIHYVTAFSTNNTCKTNIWYKGVYYTKASSKVDDQGFMYCYFKIANGSLPSEIDVLTLPVPDCKFNVFLSNLEYRFSTVKSVQTNQFSPAKKYCVYKR